MSISHWGVFPGYWGYPSGPVRINSRPAVWEVVDFQTWCRYMYGLCDG